MKMTRSILVFALMVLFIVSIIPVLAGEGESASVTLTVTASQVFPSPGYVAGILILIIAAGAAVYMLYRGGRLPISKITPGSDGE